MKECKGLLETDRRAQSVIAIRPGMTMLIPSATDAAAFFGVRVERIRHAINDGGRVKHKTTREWWHLDYLVE